jgi:hypothetical protein
MQRLARFLVCAAVLGLSIPARSASASTIINTQVHYLSEAGDPEWAEFASFTPQGRRLELTFTAQRNSTPAALFVHQTDVKLDWHVELNGRRIGRLYLMENPLIHGLDMPAGALRDGENTLAFIPPQQKDDILIGEVTLVSKPLKEALAEATLSFHVTDAQSGEPIPCRVTVADEQGALVPLSAAPDAPLAVRPGVVYTGEGRGAVQLRAGTYMVYATRGFEYGIDSRRVTLAAGERAQVQLALRREVPTPGLVACDTHVHTFTHSRHGDATIDERMLTLAGEGIELPIATDHNVHADFSEAAARMKVSRYFTPAVGNEVTTRSGHFNIFPVEPGSRVPDFRIDHWPRLMENIRATPGVKVIILNHPRDVHSNFRPFGSENFNRVTGENRRGFEFSFDGIELVNSSALQSDFMEVYHDWFALLNYGYRITGVGSSDGHDVSRYIVGQGRTYIVCADRDPGRIDLSEACRNFKAGRAYVSMGLLARISVDGRFSAGDLATISGDRVDVTVTVLGPSWVRAERVELFANGKKIREHLVSSSAPSRSGEQAVVKWSLPKPAHDVHLVAIATGPGVSAPYWAIAKPYQSTSSEWNPRVIGSTNPVWVDADGDGRFTAARGYATKLVEQFGADPAKLILELSAFDEAVAAQAASLCAARGADLHDAPFTRALEAAAPEVQRGFAAFISTLAAP